MNKKSYISEITGMTILLAAVLTVLIGAGCYASQQYQMMSQVAERLVMMYPEQKQEIIGVITEEMDVHSKEAASQKEKDKTSDILRSYGYDEKDFIDPYLVNVLPIVLAIIVCLCLLLAWLIAQFYRTLKMRIALITTYLTKLNEGKEIGILDNRNDMFSELEDEIYKTVTTLYQTREEAVKARQNYADNLANIAHQMKTPLTSISLVTQLVREEEKELYKAAEKEQNEEYITQICTQEKRLTRLSEVLLLMSRIDAGVLTLEHKEVDVYTMLQLSADTVESIARSRQIEVLLDHKNAVTYQGDMEWSIEACVNLVKNCIEHAKSQVIISYCQNPLYCEITICDDGAGFAKAEIPHLFERFYRGSRAIEGGIGIGLSLSKSLMELQNGCIEAKNRTEGGACFIIHIYRN